MRSLDLVCTTALAISLGFPAAAQTNLISPLNASSAMLHIHEGQVANNDEALDATLPAVPGPVSPWVLTQWNHPVYIHPTDVQTTWVGPSPVYSFSPADHKSSLVVRSLPNEPGLVFNLYNGNGTLSAGGGQALYLTAKLLPGVANTFDREIDLSMDARIPYALERYTTPTAGSSGAVLAMAYTGFGVMFTDPVTRAQRFVFMQVELAQSGHVNRMPVYMCNGTIPTLYSPHVRNVLPFVTDPGALHPITHNLTTYLKAMLSNPAPCDGRTRSWTANQLNPGNWAFTGLYFGSETENTDTRPGAVTKAAQGQAIVDIDVANLKVVRR